MNTTVDPLPRGLDALWLKAIGACHRLRPGHRHYLALADRVINRDKSWPALTDIQLKRKLIRISLPFQLGRDSLPHRLLAVAAIREAIRRKTGMHLFRVQIAGALALFEGHFVEMATGEGKSITAVVPAIMHGWRRRGCHVITVNDYLARRDAEDFAHIYAFAGLSAKFIEQELSSAGRRAAYAADVTYATNKEICADFLRDGIVREQAAAMAGPGAAAQHPDCVQRGLFAAVVDEADSVLIDEAVTPLIISGDAANPEQTQTWRAAVDIARPLEAGRDYRLDPRFKLAELTSTGRARIGQAVRQLPGIWRSERRREELICQTLAARHFYLRDRQYVVREDKIVIVDESTGRLMPDRHWRDGLHQAVEAREQLAIQPMKETLARISFQRFFRTYQRLSGMSGTLAEARGELWHVHRHSVVRLPPNRPCRRESHPLELFTRESVKWRRVVREICEAHASGRPVLAGTRSVHASELLSAQLRQRVLPHQVLNAHRHAEEAQIIAAAGKAEVITVATNMAGRGTDIRPDTASLNVGGLLVVATEFHESARVDRQLAGRAGRQGDPGGHIAFASLEDQLFLIHGGFPARLAKRLFPDERPLPRILARLLIRHAQNKAQRLAAAQRESVAFADEQLDESLAFSGRPVPEGA